MSASLGHEAVHRSFVGLQQWSECVASGWLFHHRARDSSCNRPIAADAAAQPVPPDGLHQVAAAQADQTDCDHREHSAPSPLPSAAPPAHCQPGGGAHGEQPDEPGPAALHDDDDPPQPHRDQEQTDAASQQTASKRTPRIAHHHHLLEDCKLGTCLATADSSRYLLAGTDSAVISVATTGGTSHRRLHRLRPLRCRGRCLGFRLLHPLAVPRHGKAGDADI